MEVTELMDLVLAHCFPLYACDFDFLMLLILSILLFFVIRKVAKEQAERRATAQLMFELGQKAYGRGMYKRSIEFFEAALTIIPRPTLFGGEVGWAASK